MALLPDENLRTLTRHEEYYIPGGDLSLLVENVVFRVHRYFFERESQYFSRKISTPLTPGTPLQGAGDDNAIVLEGLTPDEFARFLWVFYNRKYSLYDADIEDWEVILVLAQRWGFPEVKDLAVRELEKKDLPDVKRIKLYHENNVDRTYLIPRYAALCEREAPLTLVEGRDLGMETTLMIARGREEARASRTASGARSPLTPTIHGADLHEFIRELFQIGADADVEVSFIPGEATNGINGNGHAAYADPSSSANPAATTAEGDAAQTGGQDKKPKGGNAGPTTDKNDPKTGDSGAGDNSVPDTPTNKGNNKNNNKGSNKRK